ncbi:Tat-binding protein-like protein 7 [Phlyctema vagabunda]|uniref:Tat-binding protein-like protein 7 n=1 Tax=Phlyctema vagabunda TaxID=108571 RepID=A0ABR4P7X6_9HELO
MKFHVTPPRGVLFHGPPGTGKTLVARALAAQIGSGGRKITFYMRKGADALSKWVGEAERQLRLLFEEARKTQPSIIFFDEIDGLAPVRSSKQEQIHASIVSTLLALMDGMDGRGQVIVIGATNRPDNIDPALRRPGRFDREFYFPLPDIEGRKSIINIHTKDWGIDDAFKDSLAHVTKGYGGADLRALCTEAALNAIQRTYPQIYASNDKLIVDADKIKITAKDFMLSVKKMVPSSERSTSSGARPLPKTIEPLLREQLKQIESILDGLVPIKKKTTALQEAMYEQYDDEDQGFGRETLQQDFERSRVFRPRLLIGGEPGMGQAYLGGALLNHFEGLHVQSFDLPTIYADSTRSAETAIVQLFAEVKRHKPSVIYLPGIDTWYHTLTESVITTFMGLLRAIPPTDPVLVLGITDNTPDKVNQEMLRDMFGFSKKNRFLITRPSKQSRQEFFSTIAGYVRKAPKDFPEPMNRKKRKLDVLEVAPAPPPKPPTKEEIKAQKKRDHQLLNLLKVQIQPIMDQIQRKYKKFRNPVIPQNQIQYLYDEMDPNFVVPDIPTAAFRPFELDTDKDGVRGLLETASGKFFYNLETTTIEERLSNGFYARPKDFLADIKSLAKDAKRIGDKERTLKANELLSNVEVDIASIEVNPIFADCENMYHRQLQRAKEREEKHKKRAQAELGFDSIVRSDIPDGGNEESGPLTLGAAIPRSRPATLVTPLHTPSGLSNGFSADSEFHHHGSNGISVPSRSSGGDDTHMGGTDDGHPTQHTPANSQANNQPADFPGMPTGPSAASAGRNTQLSQRSIFQQIGHDTSPTSLLNDASTTTSGKKTSDGWSTQATNGMGNRHSISPSEKSGQDSQLPDTQRDASQRDTGSSSQRETGPSDQTSSSQDQWPHSQAQGLARGTLVHNYSQTPSSASQVNSQTPAVPHFNAPSRTSMSRPAGLANILNDSPVEPTSSQASSVKELVVEEYFVEDMLRKLVEGSSGCSIEQLEQINRELMDTLWRMRGEYNRTTVAKALLDIFNETIADMEQMQKIAQASQPFPQYQT